MNAIFNNLGVRISPKPWNKHRYGRSTNISRTCTQSVALCQEQQKRRKALRGDVLTQFMLQVRNAWQLPRGRAASGALSYFLCVGGKAV